MRLADNAAVIVKQPGDDVVAAHHGSLSKDRRARVELDRQSGHVTVWATEEPEEAGEGLVALLGEGVAVMGGDVGVRAALGPARVTDRPRGVQQR